MAVGLLTMAVSGRSAGHRLLPIVAITAFALFVSGVLLAGDQNGSLLFDFSAYYLAAQRLLSGAPLYDPAVSQTGGAGLYLYPPPFLLFVLPLTMLPLRIAGYLWVAMLIAATLAAIALLPVRPSVRWAVLLFAGISSPLLTALVIGQVGPLLLLLFVIAWRAIDRPLAFGFAAGLGAAIKLQPALLIAWAGVTGRHRAAIIAIAVLALLAMAVLPLAGPQAWVEEAGLLWRVSLPVLTSHAYGVGRLAFEAGLSGQAALVVHWANVALLIAVVGLAVWRASAVASMLVVMIASHFVSPVLWDHYALVLLLPTAWLLEHGQRWAIAIPLLTSALALPLDIPFLYPLAFWLALAAVVADGMRERPPETLRAQAPS